MDVTYNFTPGTRAVAQQVNTNFADVKSAVDPLETDVAAIQTQLTSGIILPDGSIDFTRLQSYATYTVSNATNATPIVITAVAHTFLTGDKVYISGVGGNTAANGIFTITKLGADTFSLDGSVGNGAFSSNGTAVIYPSSDDNLVNKAYVDRGQFGICTTAAATAEKTVTLGITALTNGLTFLVSMTNANTAATITFNVDSLGAKNVYDKRGTQITGTLFSNAANEKVLLRYNSALDGFELITADFWSARMGMPSGSYINLTLGASGTTYTTPANGWYNFSGERINGTSGSINFAIFNSTLQMSAITPIVGDYENVALILPAKKNDIVRIDYQLNVHPISLKFFYAEGSKP